MTDTSTVHKQAMDVLLETPGLTAEEVAQRLNISDEREVRKALGKDLSLMLLATSGGGAKQQEFSDDQMKEALRKVYEANGSVPMSRKAYDDKRKQMKDSSLPSAMTIVHRFSTWDGGCSAAGVPSGGHRREHYGRAWTEDQITHGVAKFITEALRASHMEYARWAKERDDVPHQVRITSERSWSELARDAFALLAQPGKLREDFLLSVSFLEDEWQRENAATQE